MRGPRWLLVLVALAGTAVLLPPPLRASLIGGPISPAGASHLRQEPAAARQQEEPPPLELLHSGRVETVRRGNDRVTDLYDSVLFRQEDQYVLADRARFLDQQEKVTLWGNVRGWDPNWRFRADRVEYFGRERTLTAEGGVRARNLQDSTYMESQRLRYNRETGEGVATGAPYLYQPPADSAGSATEVTGSAEARLRFMRDAGWAEVEGGAVVVRGDVTISGEWLRSEDEPRVLIVRDSVRFRKEGVSASGELLIWDEEAGSARLRGSPPVLHRRSAREEGSADSVFVTMRADSIDLTLRNELLERILLHGKGTVNIRTIPAPGSMRMRSDSTLVPAVPELMVLRGTDIAITLEEEDLRRLVATRAAMYYWREDAPDKQSAMGGIDLDVRFENGEPSVVTARGNATTRFFQDADDENAGIQRALAALIRLTLKDGELQVAHLENGTAKQYTMDMYRLGKVPMAVHPDSIRVGAGSRPERSRRRPPPRRFPLPEERSANDRDWRGEH